MSESNINCNAGIRNMCNLTKKLNRLKYPLSKHNFNLLDHLLDHLLDQHFDHYHFLNHLLYLFFANILLLCKRHPQATFLFQHIHNNQHSICNLFHIFIKYISYTCNNEKTKKNHDCIFQYSHKN